MPFFHHKSEDERRREEEEKRRSADAEADAQASLKSIEAGGLPLQAQRRLQDLRSRDGALFTSDLSVQEYLLTRQVGFRPISQVMGSSVYHVGWQSTPGSMYSASRELTVVSNALNHARALALGRLEQEAQLAGADAVIGVHITRANYDWAADLIEFNAVGTAIRLRDAEPARRPGLTNLSGQDFWKLYVSGHWPLGVVAASTVYYVVAGWRTQMANSFWGSWFNQELQDFTAGLYAARHLAMRRVYDQANGHGAEGIVGMAIEQSEEEREVEYNDTKRTDMIFTFHAIGTAVAQTSRTGSSPSIFSILKV